jgi:hypothetical protein
MFVEDVMANTFNYLFASKSYSVTSFKDFGDLQERGAAWLFLRWLGDHKGDGIFRQLVQTSRTGIDNVADKAGEPFPVLFGDFGIATYADSVDGVPRTSIPIRYRFTSRNTRQIFGRLFPFKPNPITPTAVACNTSANSTMLQGTSAYFIVGGTGGCANAQLGLSSSTGSSLATTLSPQLAIFRLP